MENNKTLKLTGLTEEEVNLLIKAVSMPYNKDIDYDLLVNQIGMLFLGRDQVIVHFDIINNKDHIIRF